MAITVTPEHSVPNGHTRESPLYYYPIFEGNVWSAHFAKLETKRPQTTSNLLSLSMNLHKPLRVPRKYPALWGHVRYLTWLRFQFLRMDEGKNMLKGGLENKKLCSRTHFPSLKNTPLFVDKELHLKTVKSFTCACYLKKKKDHRNSL